MVEFPKIPTRFVFTGDKAKARELMGLGRKRFADLITAMGFQELETGFNTLEFEDGRRIKTSAEYGLSKIEIYVPETGGVCRKVLGESLCKIQLKGTLGGRIPTEFEESTWEYYNDVFHMCMTPKAQEPNSFYYKRISGIFEEEVAITDLTQVRYEVPGTEQHVSLIHYQYQKKNADPEYPWVYRSVRIIGEGGIPDFLHEIRLEGGDNRVSARLDSTRKKLYLVQSIMTQSYPLYQTAIWYTVYEVGVDERFEDGRLAWLPTQNETLDYRAENLFWIDTTVDEDGLIRCFRDESKSGPGYSSTTDGDCSAAWDSYAGPFSVPDEIDHWMRSVIKSENGYLYYAYDIEAKAWVESEINTYGFTVAATGTVWDYALIQAEREDTVLSDERYIDGFSERENWKPTHIYTQKNYSMTKTYWACTPRWTGDLGERYDISYGSSSFEIWTGHWTDAFAEDWGENEISPQGSFWWIYNWSLNKDGSSGIHSSNRSHIMTSDDYQYKELESNVYNGGGGGVRNPSTCYFPDCLFWNVSPTIACDPSWLPAYFTCDEGWVDDRQLIHPYSDDSVYAVENSFISYDEETGRIFYGAKTIANFGEVSKWRIFSNNYEITSEVVGEVGNLMWDNLEIDTDNYYSLSGFEAIVFATKKKTEERTICEET